MKKATGFILVMILGFSPAASQAQNLKIMRTGEVRLPGGGYEYAMPSTTLVIDITVQREEIKTGPYARFAQRYFGAIAPLTDKIIYSVSGATIGWYDSSSDPVPTVEALRRSTEAEVASHTVSDTDFLKVSPDKMSMSGKTPEAAAQDAARVIFDIRKRRLELITGEYAETVFGEGLSTAIARMDRTENEYMELFYGKQISSRETVRYTVVPQSGQDVYVVCRWSESGGLLPSSDLTGQPVMLELRPEGRAQQAYSAITDKKRAAPKGSSVEEFTIADNVACRILEGKRELAARTVPIFQFGVKAMLPE